jgi:phage-related protein
VSLFDNIWRGIQDFFTKMWSGIDSFFSDIWNKITGFFGSVGDFFKNLWKEAFNWGKNLIQNIGDGIANAWNSVVDGVKSVGQSIKDFLGFGSPTKKGPGHTADEWIPNLLHMMEQGLYTGAPNIEKASAYVANSLNLTATNKQVVGVGTSPYGDLLNGLLQANGGVNTSGESQKDIILQVDGQTFARLMMPKLNKEYKRNGVKLKEV